MRSKVVRFTTGICFLFALLLHNHAYAFEEIRNKQRKDLEHANKTLANNPAAGAKAELLLEKAKALDSLGQHSAALDAINESIAIHPSIGATLSKSIILRSTGRLQQADEPLVSWFKTYKDNFAVFSTMFPYIGEIQLQRAILSIRLQKWDEAMFYAQKLAEWEKGGYGAILARYVASRSGKALLTTLPKSTTSPYTELEAMFDNKIVVDKFDAIETAASPYEKAVLQSEVEFFIGVYLRYAAKDQEGAKIRFRKLSDMQWYGSAEQELAVFELEK